MLVLQAHVLRLLHAFFPYTTYFSAKNLAELVSTYAI